jgi:tetratricopeptide (TPR) repeat protein
MPKALFVLLFLALIGFEQRGIEAQTQAQTSPKKPITLPLFDPDVSPAQKAVLSLIQKGTTEDRRGDYGSAIKTFEGALRQLRSLPEMKGEEDSLLVRLGRAYIGARRFDDATSTFSLLLAPRMEDCRQGVAAVEYCADAQHYIGLAHMQKGNFDAAVPFLTKSIASYARAASGSEFVEYRMIKVKQQAETETMLAQALLRTCHKEGAINSLNHSISQLSTVAQNTEIQESIRASAGESLQDAQITLALAQKNIPSPPGCAN